jgi:hypothetical protein
MDVDVAKGKKSITNHAIATAFFSHTRPQSKVLRTDQPTIAGIGEESGNSETTAMAQRIRGERVVGKGVWSAIAKRRSKSKKLREMRKIEGSMINGREERVYSRSGGEAAPYPIGRR